MEDLINEFRNEAAGIVTNVQHGLLLIEDEGGTKGVDDIFRGIHTLKGSSRMFGYLEIEKITHELENIFAEIRDGKRELDSDTITLALKVMDMVQNILNGEYDQKEYFVLYSKLQIHDEGAQKSKPKETTISCSCFQVLYHPSEDVYSRGVNPFGALEELKELGDAEVIEIYRELSDEEQITQKKFTTQYEILLSIHGTQDDLQDVFMFMQDDEYDIYPIDEKGDDTLAGLEERVQAVLPAGKKLSKKLKEEREQKLKDMLGRAMSAGVMPKPKSVEKKEEWKPAIKENTSTLNYINVKLDRLDEMMKLMSELVSVKAELAYHAEVLDHSELTNSVERLEKITTKFKDNAFSMRLVPLQILRMKLQRLVRDSSAKLGKDINLITEGLETEIDKSIISEIEAPLMHIIQNALDHGIESPEERIANGKTKKGLLKILAFYAGANVFIQIQDDGKGLDLKKIKEKAISVGLISKEDNLTEAEIINLIFEPGFTTKSKTSQYSGRGVGMDVVMNKIRQLRGSVEVTTEEGLGTSFTLRLPLSLSIIDVLHVKVGDINYLIPHNEVVNCLNERLNRDIIRKEGFNVKFEGKLIPHINLMEAFDERSKEDDLDSEPSIIILNKNEQDISIEVENIIGEAQLVIKPVDEALHNLEYLAGVSVLGNGELAFLLDVLKLKEHNSATREKNDTVKKKKKK